MSYDYSENKLVQDSAGEVLEQKLGWRVVYAYDKEIFGEGGTFGRKSPKEILLVQILRRKLRKLNGDWITDKQIGEAVEKMLAYSSTDTLLQTNEKKYAMIRDGIEVTVTKPDGKTELKKAIVIDFANPLNNDFLAVKEMKIHSELYRRRTDIVGFVNGIPLLFVELKKQDKDVKNAYTDNYLDYLNTIPKLFFYNAFLMLSNGLEAKVGTLGSLYKFFHEWKRLNEEESGCVDLETMLLGICKKENLLDLVENFILYDKSGGKTVKIMARNHQYLGVNAAVEAYRKRKQNDGKLGVFWHTQGSGKSYSMVFMAQKIRRKFEGTPTILVLTDRTELNKQISGTFENCGLLSAKASEYIAKSSEDLYGEHGKLRANKSFVFSLIHKFNNPNAEPIIPEHDIIVMCDEAHRTQNGYFARNMERVLPTASRIGFTGTPLFSFDEITKRTFGDYVSVYDFNRAVEDGATVPLVYENRGDMLKIENPELTDEIFNAIEAADLDEDQREKAEAQIAKQVHVLTAEPRLREIAKDFVKHYTDLWTTGKAMFVCLRRDVCVKMYNYAQEYWQEELQALESRLKKITDQQQAQELQRKIDWMKETEMACVFSQEQNETTYFEKWGLDVLPHRQKMLQRELDKEFKDADNPFRIVFVCAMWMTGFDVPSLTCLYIDKPLKAHTLMQAIARANRVCEGKENGIIVDYVGVVKALREALATYTADEKGRGGKDPTIDKKVLLERILEDLAKAKKLLADCGFELQTLIDAQNFEKLKFLQGAAEAVSYSENTKNSYQTYATEIATLWKYLDREEKQIGERKECEAVIEIGKMLKAKVLHSDTTDLMVAIHKIINDHIKVEKAEGEGLVESRRFDISKIDFNLLAAEFASSRTQRLILRDLEQVIEDKLHSMLSANSSRINFYERYQEIIEAYNREQDRATIEKTFDDLMKLVDDMKKEEQRFVREGFKSDEELAMYDLLFKENLSKKDIDKIKAVSVELLAKIKTEIAKLQDWTQKYETRAQVQNLIRDTLYDELPDSYTDENIRHYRETVYEYIYGKYPEVA